MLDLPGHSPGGSGFLFEEADKRALFTGDTLFAGDIGRTDLYSGSEEEMIETLKLFKDLPHDLRVLPGHGPASTIGRELKVNPYLVALG